MTQSVRFMRSMNSIWNRQHTLILRMFLLAVRECFDQIYIMSCYHFVANIVRCLVLIDSRVRGSNVTPLLFVRFFHTEQQ